MFLAGLGIVLFGVFGLSATAQFPGVGAIGPRGGALLIIYADRRSVGIERILANPAAVFVGRISYPLYLWHWPVYFAFRRVELTSPTGYAVAIGVAFVLSVLTYLYIKGAARRSAMPASRAHGV